MANLLTSSFTVTVPTASVNLAGSLPTGVATVGTPARTYAQSISTFTGIAGVDWGGGVGGFLTSVQVQILDQAATQYWETNGFATDNPTNGTAWNTAAGTTTWTYYSSFFSPFTFVHKHSYTIWARGLSSDGGVGFNLSSATVVIDNKDPSQTGEGSLLITGPLSPD